MVNTDPPNNKGNKFIFLLEVQEKGILKGKLQFFIFFFLSFAMCMGTCNRKIRYYPHLAAKVETPFKIQQLSLHVTVVSQCSL